MESASVLGAFCMNPGGHIKIQAAEGKNLAIRSYVRDAFFGVINEGQFREMIDGRFVQRLFQGSGFFVGVLLRHAMMPF